MGREDDGGAGYKRYENSCYKFFNENIFTGVAGRMLLETLSLNGKVLL